MSWVLRTLRQVAKLLDAKARSNMFFLEYTVQKPDEDQPRHFLSAVSLGYNGRCAIPCTKLQHTGYLQTAHVRCTFAPDAAVWQITHCVCPAFGDVKPRRVVKCNLDISQWRCWLVSMQLV